MLQVDSLGKSYVINRNRQPERYVALRDVWVRNAKALVRNLTSATRSSTPKTEGFWALKDVSFDVEQGERVGIIGRNGAGKSTLLKILSRITEPTTGRVQLKGRVASLLEVGTGFHPELTGRENIFLNGAILGMGRAEIRRKFDEIVAFAEVEQFIDTPVKRYSSGMYVRLAFAVAAHLEPEILVVDEVLAVGDVKFQRKCLGKMEEVGQSGRTVLFVSHQMSAVERLCSRAIVLDKGQIQYQGSAKESINYYLSALEKTAESVDIANMKRTGTGQVVLTGFSIENAQGQPQTAVACGESVVLVFHYRAQNPIAGQKVSLGFSIRNNLGDMISILYSDYSGILFELIEPYGKIKCTIEDFPFSMGRYFVGVRILVNGVEADWPRDFIGIIDVEAGDFYGDGQLGHSGIGPILLRGEWQSV